MRNILAMLVILLTFGNAAHAAELFATVESLSGSAYVSYPSGQPSDIFVGQKIYEKQTISTAQDGEVHITTADGGIIAIRQNTVFRADEYKADGSPGDKIFMSLAKGAIRSITGWIGKFNAPSYRITTPTATIGIRGTDHETTVIEDADGDEPGTYDIVNEGVTVLKTQYGESEVTPEKFAFAPKHRAVAPFFLAQKPGFLAKRKLKIEERIQQKKESLRNRIEQIREERIKHLKKTLGERPGKTGDKAAAKEEHAKMRASRQEKAEQRHEARRNEASPRRKENPGEPGLRPEKRNEMTRSGIREKAERFPREQRRRPERKDKN
ncbi:MAG: FecR domain-containing protein [Nitrosomonadales bacterium]|nr:FecR domain-containing protein [Nitrosomonadales bacterium]